ncbi:acyl-CoA dehydrogenase family protein [Acrocarpospora catenulata]|uniref:acyl-CoA dehydrogenase family protein n=1 Tax=Acrocarpospora catenulata TaxID=2836182 RepID=UPI001BDB06AF|nr:acyl-CoA dehydrogenase family protein [Acrocarpospora catenulata]
MTGERSSFRQVVRQVLADSWPPLAEYASGVLPPNAERLRKVSDELGWWELEDEDGGFAFASIAIQELGGALGPGELLQGLCVNPVIAGSADPRRVACSWGDSGPGGFSGEVSWCLAPGDDVERVLVFAEQTGEPVAALVRSQGAGARLEPMTGSDPTRRFWRLVMDGVPPGEPEILARGDEAALLMSEVEQRVSVGLALDSLGIARSALALTVAYAKIREQFGAPIGSFQAVKHRCVDMFVLVETADVLVEAAVTALASGAPLGPSGVASIAMAKAASCDAAAEVTRLALQTHGGIGYTWEHPCHLLLRRAKLNQALGRNPRSLRRAVAGRLVADALTGGQETTPLRGERK